MLPHQNKNRFSTNNLKTVMTKVNEKNKVLPIIVCKRNHGAQIWTMTKLRLRPLPTQTLV